MLDGVHGVITFAQLCPALAAADFAHMCANPRRARTIDAMEDDTLPLRRRLESDAAWHSQVQADPLQHRWTGQCLSTHLDLGSSSNFSKRRIIPANLNNAADARSASRCGRAG